MNKTFCRILLVEDSPSDAVLLKTSVLTQAGNICISVVQSLKEASEHIRENLFDVILLDLNLPDSSGLDTVRCAKLFNPDLPIVVLTGNDDEDTGIESVRIGAQDYLVKGQMSGRAILRSIRYAIERKRVSRTLEAINRCNQVIMREENEPDLLREICGILVEGCGYTMAWIGFADVNDEKTVRPAAYSGFEKGCLEALKITWSEEQENNSIGKAIRTNEIGIYKNLSRDSQCVAFRDEIIKCYYESSVILPLQVYGKAFGMLAIYSKEPDSFTEEEIKPLSLLAVDISICIMELRLNAVHTKAETALRDSEEQFRSVFNEMTEGFAYCETIYDDTGKMSDYRYLRINPAYEKITGLKKENIIGKLSSEIETEDPVFLKFYQKSIQSSKPDHFEFYSSVRKKYYEIFIYCSELFRFNVLMLDNTVRRQAEDELKALKEARNTALTDSSTELIKRTDPSGAVVFVNEAYCKCFGVKAADLTGSRTIPYLVVNSTMPDDEKYKKLLQKKKEAEYVCKVKLNTGNYKWISFIDRAFFNDNNEWVEIQSVGKDITEKKEMEEMISEKEKIIEEQKQFLNKIESYNNKKNKMVSRMRSFMERFTEREKEIVKCLVKGMSYKEISAKLKIHEKTVDTHAQNIYQKAQVTGRGYLIGVLSKFDTDGEDIWF